MATELGTEGEADQRLNMALGQYETDEILKATAEQKNAPGGHSISGSRMIDQSLSILITEYDKQLEEMREQLQLYQEQMREMRLKFEQVAKENENLHAELKDALEKQLEAFPFMPLETDIPADEGIVRNLQEQLQLVNQEKQQAIELWQTVLQEHDRLQQQYEARGTETQIHVTEKQKQKDQLTGFQQVHIAHDKMELALFGEKQKEEEIKKMKDEMSQLAEDTAARIRKAVDSAKKQYNVQISRLTEELSALQMECGEKQGQIERAIREKRAVEEELEKIYREDRGNESGNRKLEQLHQKYLFAETTKGDLQLSLQTTQNKLKQLEMNSEEEKSRCQEVICKLQSTLDSEREKSTFVSEQRLKLQQENEQLQKEMEGLRKLAIEAQQKAKIKISIMEHEHAVKEHGYEVRLKEMEDTSQKSTAELRRLLVAQQKATNRWKEETKSLTEITEARICKLKSELSQQKLRNQELISQLEMANEKVTEDEKLMVEYREYINRLQKRLSQAEQRAATASQKLSLITTKKKKAASLKDLENT
ncbi:sodium channel and clathrin linker 1 isoform X3 [Athene noctua]|uniref:sodium channel and clathrin linker 1 isoform X3 n=1 Tax=Athene noctua TaxID=126797 RepID=UPI003EB79E1C